MYRQSKDRQTVKQTEEPLKQTERHTDCQINRESCRQTDGQAGRERQIY